MGQLTYLLDEICAGLEIYYTGRYGGQYYKTAFVLCDDYTELTAKLFLLTENPGWSDTKASGGFKNYHDVLSDVHSVIRSKRIADLPKVEVLHAEMKARRARRNDFFHSTKLLDLSVTQRIIVESYCDLLDYGQLLFEQAWVDACALARNLETMDALLRLEKRSFSDPSINGKVNRVFQHMTCNDGKRKKGVHMSTYPEDLHLRMSITWGSQALRDQLRAI